MIITQGAAKRTTELTVGLVLASPNNGGKKTFTVEYKCAKCNLISKDVSMCYIVRERTGKDLRDPWRVFTVPCAASAQGVHSAVFFVPTKETHVGK